MGIALAILVLAMLVSLVWLGCVVCIDLAGCFLRKPLRFRFDLLDLLIATGGIGAWLATARLMQNSTVIVPTLLFVTMLVPLMWILKVSCRDAAERQRLRRERLAVNPQNFELPAQGESAKPRRFFHLRSRANSLLAPRLSRYSLSERPMQLEER
jgi:hypothetical protein